MSSDLLDSDSEFGYDFSAEEEQLLLQLTSRSPTIESRQPLPNLTEHAQIAVDLVSQRTGTAAYQDAFAFDARNVKKRSGSGSTDTALPYYKTRSFASSSSTPKPPLAASPLTIDEQDICYPDLSRALAEFESETPPPPAPQAETAESDAFEDERSPLQRFRSYPRKPLTVTDLTSGAWCELQYWYTLTRLPGGRRTRTAAMRQGSKVHQQLEDEVHTTVKIDIMTKEDAFGLRLWNLVQGLRTLRETGLTRELEVWGMIDGNLVNGVIDGVSHENPNAEFEEELSSQESQANLRQSKLKDYFPPKQTDKVENAGSKIYLTDVKTRGTLAPVSKALLRPAKIQLLLYHRFLSDMAAGKLDFLQVFRRYGLDPDDSFSDTFIAQVGSLHDEIFVDARSTSELESPDATDDEPDANSQNPDFLKYRTLRELLPLVRDELNMTFPHGEHSLGHMLRVQYVYRADGRELDQHDFPVSRQALEAYLRRYMAWWRGEREARGVEIEEAFKCRTCEFASDCSWRQGMDAERVRKAQQKVLAARQGNGS